MAGPAKRPLRVGVMLNSTQVTAWTHKVLQDIAESDCCELALAMIDDRPSPSDYREPGILERLRGFWKQGAFNLYARWDRNRYREPRDAFETVDATPLIPDTIRMKVVPKTGRFTDRFSAADVETVRAADLDVLIRFGFRILKGGILDCARYGVWSYHHGDNREYRGGPALFWELYERNPVSGTVLQVLTEDLDAGHVIYRSWSATHFDSLYLNRNANYWKASGFVIRCLRDLHARGWDYVIQRESQDSRYDKPIYRAPNAFKVGWLMVRRTIAASRNKLDDMLFQRYNHWRLIVRPAGSWAIENEKSREWHLVPPTDRFYADPFLLKKDNRNFVFFEDYRFLESKGLISCAEIGADGSFGEPEVVLDRGYHLSYPFVFEHEGETFMIPETRSVNRVELYRAIEFPHKWQFEGVMLDNITAVDATVHKAGDRLWLFCNIAPEGVSTCDELHLFSGDSLLGPWKPHPRNPVVSDVRRARPAGRLFMHEGALIRPAQDCSVRYGYAIQLHRVDALTESDYREEPFRRITPAWQPGSIGTHTLDQGEDFEVLDAKFPLRKFRVPQLRVPGVLQQLEK